MSDPKATVVVPTHNHGRLLSLSVRSALEQSIDAIEVFIICDGATEETLQSAEELASLDRRIRLFVHEKGPRHGEIYRHRALQEATGEIVCYLSDDDLWLPDHVANMAELLESADFAHSYPIGIDPDGEVFSWPGHLSIVEVRQAMLEGTNFIPLPCGAHTLELYHRLPHGWRTTPDGTHTDLYMWQQILTIDGVRLSSSGDATVLHFPSSLRPDVAIEERFEELQRWSAASRDPDFPSEINRRARENLAIEWARTDVHSRNLTRELARTTGRLEAAQSELADAMDAIVQLDSQLQERAAERAQVEAERDSLAADLRQALEHTDVLEERVAQLSNQVRWMTNSRTWRTREALLRVPGMARLLRRAGTARSR